MGLMDGLSRGLSAAGYATADLFSQKALQEQRAQLEEEKALRIADAAEARRREGKQFDLDMANNPDNVRKSAESKVMEDDIVGKATSARETKAVIDRAGTPGYLDAVRAEKKAGHIDTTDYAGRKVTNELNQLRLNKERESAKIPPAVQASFDALKTEAAQVSRALLDAQAKDMLSPEGEQKLLEKQRAVTEKMGLLMQPYMPKTDAPAKSDGGPIRAPHADGTRLRKGGVMYIVKDGVPVPETEAARTSSGKIKQ